MGIDKEYIYHYTKIENLEKIITSGEVTAKTSGLNFNDESFFVDSAPVILKSKEELSQLLGDKSYIVGLPSPKSWSDQNIWKTLKRKISSKSYTNNIPISSIIRIQIKSSDSGFVRDHDSLYNRSYSTDPYDKEGDERIIEYYNSGVNLQQKNKRERYKTPEVWLEGKVDISKRQVEVRNPELKTRELLKDTNKKLISRLGINLDNIEEIPHI